VVDDVLCQQQKHVNMSTIGKRYLERTSDKKAERVLDARTKAILNSVLSEPRGQALSAYLCATGIKSKRGQ
jgi:hypothetical protein